MYPSNFRKFQTFSIAAPVCNEPANQKQQNGGQIKLTADAVETIF